MNKILLYIQIRKFYNIFNEVVGENFITALSDMTDDNVSSVAFDINEVLECYDLSETDEMYVWCNKLLDKVNKYHNTSKLAQMCGLAILVSLLMMGCAKPIVHTQYTTYGRYYTDGTVITNDGNEWGYTTDTVSDKTPYDAMPVWVAFDDNGTADITDDIILGLVYDRETAIYDALETALGDTFQLERDGNNIHIGGTK
jgi:hypothetical protein